MKEEPKNSRIEGVQTSGNDVSPVQAEQIPITPQKLPGEPNEVQQPSTSPSSPGDPSNKPPVSAKKLESNKKNAQKSHGPTTEAGKAKSANNSFKHGFYAKRLFPTAELEKKDREDYQSLLTGLRAFYRPEGFLEDLLIEKIAVESLRLARLLGYEQTKMMAWTFPFEQRTGDQILRFQTAANRQLIWAIEKLERLQSQRKVDEVPAGPPEPVAIDTVADMEQPSQPPDTPADEASIDKSIAESDVSVTAAESFGEQSEVSSSDATASAENVGTNPPATEGGGQLTGPYPHNSDGRSKRSNPGSDSSQAVVNGGTNPTLRLADIVAKMLDKDL
jgi:hypothetical protein